jgi:hypothetical protein
MYKFILSILVVLAASPAADANEIKDYEVIYEKALYECPYRNWKEVDGVLLWKLVEIEKKFQPPRQLRGMLLAAACRESGYNPKAKGDYRKGKPKAIGLLQQWPWAARFYKIDRNNPVQAADAWMQHVVRQLKHVRKKCKHKSAYKIWRAAWVTAIRAPKKNGRCNEESLHFHLLKKWKRTIKKEQHSYEKYLEKMKDKGEYIEGC